MNIDMPADPTSFVTGHVGLNVVDLDRSLEFYRGAFGFDLVGQGTGDERRWAFLGTGATPVLTLWQQADRSHAPSAAGLHHLSFMVDTVDEVQAVETRLKALGAEFAYDGLVPHAEGAESGGIYFSDPDGIRLEIFAPSGVTGQAPHGVAPSCGLF